MRKVLSLAVLIGLAATRGASADEFVADSASNVSLKAPGGYYEKALYEITPSGPSALRARITVSKFEDNPNWLTSFSFAVVNGDDFLGFQIVRTEVNRLTTYFRKFEKGDDKTVIGFDFEPREGEAFTLQMEWHADGKLTASVGGEGQMERRDAMFGLPPKQLRIIASGGSLDITPLELGHTELITSGLLAARSDHPTLARGVAFARSTRGACASPLGGTTHCRPRQ